MREPWQPVKQARNTWRGERAPGRRIEFRARPPETQGIPSGQHPLQRTYKESQFRNGISEMLEDLEVLESVSALRCVARRTEVLRESDFKGKSTRYGWAAPCPKNIKPFAIAPVDRPTRVRVASRPESRRRQRHPRTQRRTTDASPVVINRPAPDTPDPQALTIPRRLL
jgi:hypothetical protein